MGGLVCHAADRIDNVKWVKEHATGLTRAADADTYILTYHPFAGRPSSTPGPLFEGSEPIEELSEMADAMTVAGMGQLPTKPTLSWEDATMLGTTAIANLAYVGLHHSHQQTRREYRKLVHKWRVAVGGVKIH